MTFFKIVNGLPSGFFLTEMLPPRVGSNIRQNVRNDMDFYELICRLAVTIFPSVLHYGYSIETIGKIEFPKIESVFNELVPKTFLVAGGVWKYSVIQTQLRNKCSNLNNGLSINHITPSPPCGCSSDEESAFDFFFVYPLYSNARRKRLQSLNKLDILTTIDILHGGSSLFSPTNNCCLLRFDQGLVTETNRFMKSIILPH